MKINSETPETLKRQVLIFIALTYLITWMVMGYIINSGGINGGAGRYIIVAMWVPGLIGLILAMINRTGFADFGFKTGPFKFWLIAILVPLFVATIAYSLSWMTGVSAFQSAPTDMLIRNNVSSSNELVFKVYPWILLFGSLAALGEELGWRGFMLPKMIRAGIKRPFIVSSIIWGVWHIPAILWGGYATSNMPWVSVLLFMITIIIAGCFAGWLRMSSGSIWVVTIFHAAHNLFLQTAFEVFNKPGPLSPYLSGESGLYPSLAYLIVLGGGYMLFSRRLSLKKIA